MNIKGYDYHFAYTVGAYCDIADLHFAPPKTRPEQCRIIMNMAVIMSKAYEDKKALENPEHKVKYLTMPLLRALSIEEVVETLMPEVNGAVAEGAYRTVEAEAPKNANSAAQ